MQLRYNLYIVNVLAVIVFTAIGCQDTEYPEPKPAEGSSASTANIFAIHASPDAPALTFLVNNIQIGTPLNFGSSFSNYVSTPVGQAQVKASAQTGTIGGTIGSGSILYRGGATNQNNFTFANGSFYTVFVIDTLNRPKPTTVNATNPGGPQFLGPVRDNLSVPPTGSAKVRFLNLAPGAPDVSLSAGSVTLAGRGYSRTASSGTPSVDYVAFSNIPSGNYTLNVSGTGVSVTNDFTFQEGKIYTVYLTGQAVKSGNTTIVKKPFAVKVVQHN